MKLTKTWLSYIIWGFFSIIFFTNVGIAAIEINQRNNMDDFMMPMLIMYGGTVFGILLLYLLYKVYERYILKKVKKDDDKNTITGPLEWFAFALIVFVAIAVRVIAIISSTGQFEGSTLFYDFAVGSGTGNGFGVHSNGNYVFTGILSFILSFLGHIPMAAMGVQAGIQVVTIIVAYFMIKKALGILPAWISLLLMSFLPGSFMAVRNCTPDGLFGLLFVLYLFALVSLGEANRSQKIRLGAHAILYVLVGLFAAVLTYYDIIGLLCVVFTVVVFLQYKNEDSWVKVQKSWFQIMMFMISYVFFTVILLWFLPTGGMEAGPATLISYAMSLIPNGTMNLMILTPHKGQWDSLALFILAGIWFVGFLRDKKDKAFPYVFVVVCLTLFSFLGIGNFVVQDYPLFISFLWIVLSAVGITSMDVFRKNERDVAVAEKAKRENIERKEKRERKRAEAAGEKSFNLEEVHKKHRASEQVLSNSNTSKKGYGIGRKSDATYEETKEISLPKNEEETSVAMSVAAIPVAAPVAERPVTVVKSVDKPPVVSAPIPVPVESKPAYSQGSRSRRALRSPSKSTFTQEDLERISRYTGVSYMASHTIITPQEETVVSEAADVSASYIEIDNAPAEVQPVVTETVEVATVQNVTEYAREAEPVINEELKLEEPFETTEQVATAEYSEETEPVETTVQSEAEERPEAETNIEQAEISTEETETSKEAKSEAPAVLPAYVSPARRHYRQPSKSTFSADELEKISQYTGIQYKPAEEKVEEKIISAEDKTEVVNAEVGDTSKKTEVSEKKEATESKKTQNASDLKDIKQQSDRKPKMIRNPLPGPKPHVPKELNYDYIPKASEMKFDIDDLKGRDYFDI